MSIRLRVIVATVLLVAVAVVAADVTGFWLFKRYSSQDADKSVHLVATTAAAAIEGGKKLSLALFPSTARPALVELLTRDGRVLQVARTPDATSVELPTAALLARPGSSQRLASERLQAIAVPLADGRTVIAAVAVGPSMAELAHLSTLNFQVAAAVILLAAIVAALVLTSSLRPLRRIAATADAIAAGSMGDRIPLPSKGSEIAPVATALNRMLSEIEQAFAARDATEERLRRLLADASHELRTPLTSIRGYAELFRRGADQDPDDLAAVMRAIEDESARMTRLVDDLLLLARLDDQQPLERQPLALDDIVEAAAEAATVVDRTRPLDLDLGPRPTVVTGDGGRLRQLIDNLLSNTRQHTPPGTAVSVRLSTAANEAVLRVADTGPGIPTEEQERIFDRFFRLDGARSPGRGGTGLGLAIVQAIATAHNGRVTVANAQPHGAAFELRIPLATRQVPHRTPQSSLS
jgi:two-component system OmpR family sensor kinase